MKRGVVTMVAGQQLMTHICVGHVVYCMWCLISDEAETEHTVGKQMYALETSAPQSMSMRVFTRQPAPRTFVELVQNQASTNHWLLLFN